MSASKAERWLNCTPSARLEEAWIKKHGRQSSVYADEGTLAHEIAEVLLSEFAGAIPPDQAFLDVSALKSNPLYSEEMDGYVDTYVSYVKNRTSEMAEQSGLTIKQVLKVESLSDFSEAVPEGTGIADAAMFDGSTLEIADLKYGKGVRVEAEENPQLQLYAWGILQAMRLLYEVKEIRMTIVQPRLDHIVTWTTTPEELDNWIAAHVVPKAKLAWKGKGEATPGEHCKFCVVKPKCKAFANLATKIAQQEFAPGEPKSTITDEELSELSRSFSLIEDWISAARTYMLQKALEGKSWPGMKLVESRTMRKWTNEPEIRKKLIQEGYKESEFSVTKLKGIGDIERLLGKKEFERVLSDFVEKPEGSPQLAPESDKREAIRPSGVSTAV
ncbi:MAG: DUF2800 domain-containing protein, partial [Spirochaetales bacterium]|nr:DUF2800 domain-containing protein [Spirochaetales bacterium]